MPSGVVTDPAISIVLVTLNGAATLPAVLDAIDSQDVGVPFEVIAVDSGSTDGTQTLLDGRVNTILPIEPAAFNHGTTRNLGVRHARGNLVVLLVQDAIPVSRSWLASLVAPFAADPTLAGVFCRQTPRADASALTRFYLERWRATDPRPRHVRLDRSDQLDALSPLERLDLCTFDNVCSCVRRSVWSEHPFAATPIAEDIEWARTVLTAGYGIAYVPEAIVEHSHDRTARYEFARTYTLHRRLFQLLGVRTVPSAGALVRAIASSLRDHLQCGLRATKSQSAGSWWRAVSLAVAWPLGQYLGALSAVRGWRPLRVRGV